MMRKFLLCSGLACWPRGPYWFSTRRTQNGRWNVVNTGVEESVFDINAGDWKE